MPIARRQIQDGAINNAKIAADAAIATSKLADGASFLRNNGSVALSGNLNAGGFLVTNLGTPTLAHHAATKAYVDGLLGGGFSLSNNNDNRVITATTNPAIGNAEANLLFDGNNLFLVAAPVNDDALTQIVVRDPATGQLKTRSASTISGVTSLSALSDALIATPATDQLLRYNGTKWVNWAPNFLTSFTETDPVFQASAAAGITSGNITNWNAAFGWGNHASAGYLTAVSAASAYQPLDADLSAIAGLAGASGLLRKTAVNTWALDTTVYLTSFTETDPVFTASVAAGITSGMISNWNTAYGWGNHASAGYLLASTAATTYQALDADLTAIAALAGTSGLLRKTAANTWSLDTNTYLTSFTETDPTVPAHVKGITALQIGNWDTAFGWGNHASAGYLTAVSAASAYQPLDGDLSAIAGLAGASGLLRKTAANTWTLDTNTYLTSFTETDPTVPAHVKGVTALQIGNWDTAFGWGNHALAGYLTVTNAANNRILTAAAAGIANAEANLTFDGNTFVLTGSDNAAGTYSAVIRNNSLQGLFSIQNNGYFTLGGTGHGLQYLNSNGLFIYSSNTFLSLGQIDGNYLTLGTSGAGQILFTTSAISRGRITETGEFWLAGTSWSDQGNYKLQVEGSIYSSGANSVIGNFNLVSETYPTIYLTEVSTAKAIRMTANTSINFEGAAFQLFHNSDPTYGGNVYFDSGAKNEAAIIFRTAITGAGSMNARFKIDSAGNLFIVTAPANDNALTQILVRDDTTGQLKYRTAASLLSGGTSLTINTNADNRILTANGGTTSIDAEANLTWNGSSLIAERTVAPVSGQENPTITAKSGNEYVTMNFEHSGTSYPRVSFNYTGNAANAGFVNKLNGVSQFFFGMSNEGLYGGSAGTDSGRFMGYYDFVSTTWKYGFNALGELFLGSNSSSYGVKLSGTGSHFSGTGGVGIGVINDSVNRLIVRGFGTSNTTAGFRVEDSNGILTFGVRDDGALFAAVLQQDDALIRVVVQDVATGQFKYRAASTLSGGASLGINNNVDNRILTANGGTTTVDAEANLTFNGSRLALTGDFKLGSYSYFAETAGGLATLFGNNVYPGANPNTIIRATADPGNYINMRYNRGIIFGTNVTSTVGAEIADDTNERMRLTPNGNLLINKTTDYTYRVDADGSFRFTHDGIAQLRFFNNGNAPTLALERIGSSGYSDIWLWNNGDVRYRVESAGYVDLYGATGGWGWFRWYNNGLLRMQLTTAGNLILAGAAYSVLGHKMEVDGDIYTSSVVRAAVGIYSPGYGIFTDVAIHYGSEALKLQSLGFNRGIAWSGNSVDGTTEAYIRYDDAITTGTKKMTLSATNGVHSASTFSTVGMVAAPTGNDWYFGHANIANSLIFGVEAATVYVAYNMGTRNIDLGGNTNGYMKLRQLGNTIIGDLVDNGYKLQVNGALFLAYTGNNHAISIFDGGRLIGSGGSGHIGFQTSNVSFHTDNLFVQDSTTMVTVHGNKFASTGSARGLYVSTLLTAFANNDTLVGLDINPTFTPGAFTGVKQIGLRVQSGTVVIGSLSLNASLTNVVVHDPATGQLYYKTVSSGLPAITPGEDEGKMLTVVDDTATWATYEPPEQVVALTGEF